MTRIAFTACAKFNFDPEQHVWAEILDKRPDHLLLLGDQIYMDFKGDGGKGPGDFIGYKLGEPRKSEVSLQEFSFQMRLRYQQQFGVPSFRALVRDIGKRDGTVAMVWDDHDFGFNNALGQAGGPSDDEFEDYLMPPDKKLASRRLFEEFRWNVQRLRLDAAAAYGDLPDDMAPGDTGVQSRVTLGQVDVFLLDTRSFRESPARHGHPTASRILGDAQWDQLRDGLIASEKKLVVIAAGSPLSSPGLFSDQSWKQDDRGKSKYQPYREYQQLLDLAGQLRPHKQLLFIGGDRHAIDIIEDQPDLPEFVCAGAAAPKGWPIKPNGRHFGLLDVTDASQATVRLFEKGQEEETWQVEAQPLVLERAFAATTGPVQTAWPFSDLFLVTNREFDKHDKPTDDQGTTLRYYRFDGKRFQANARRLRNWDLLDATSFWAAVGQSADRLRKLRPNNFQQVCLFVPGNRESNETAIEQYRTLNDIAFHAQGNGCMGTCILFDWATRMGHFDFQEIYRENIERSATAGRWLRQLLDAARAVTQPANAQLSLVAHSLGNRVALAALEGMPADSVDRYFANAADLPQDVFGSSQGQAALRACQSVLVTYTGLDQVLGYAATFVPEFGPRLGETGPAPLSPVPARLHAKDVSHQVSGADAHGCLLWFPWPPNENAGGLQKTFAHGLGHGHW